MLVKCSKKSLFGEITRTQFGSKLCNLLFYLFALCCSMKEYSRYTIVTVHYAKKSLLGQIGNLDPIWAKIMQPYICLKGCRMNGACYVDISYGSQFFQKNPLLEEISNVDPNLPRFFQPSVL